MTERTSELDGTRVPPASVASSLNGMEFMVISIHGRDESSLRTDVGRHIREWRLRRELSQAEVARRSGITQASLSNYENGKRDLPLSTLIGIAGALNVSLGDLLDLPDMIVVRDSLLGRAVEQLQTHVPQGTEAFAAS